MDLVQFSIELLSILFFTAIVAGFLDTLAGGGGLITIPALMLTGMPPLVALGTNKLQGTMGTATSTFIMMTRKRVRWHDIKYLMLSAFIGSAIGTIALQFINTTILSFVIPATLLLIAIYFLISPKPNAEATPPSISDKKFSHGVIPCIGFYDGMFGPGTGSFFALAGVSCKKQDLITATATAKPLNFSTNIASLFVFLWTGHILWVAGILMMLGQFIGAQLGSHFLLKINPAYLRIIIVVMCFAMLAKYSLSMGWLSL